MAVYKVIQDIESEDKLLGPLTLKGFIYAAIAGMSAFINVRLAISGAPPLLKISFITLFAMPMIVFGVLASPLGREQPTEVWLLSRIRFFLKPRQRIWDQEGMSELVTITAPKKVEARLTKDLSPGEVQSRLKTLATTLDTRGWAIKNVDVNLSTPEAGDKLVSPGSDRLISDSALPRQTPVVDVHAADDIMDEKNNPTAQKFDEMVRQADADRKQGIIEALKEVSEEDSAELKHTKGRSKKSTKDLPATKAALAKLRKTKSKVLDTISEEKMTAMQRKLAEARAKFTQDHSQQNKSGAKHKVLAAAPAPAPAQPVQPPAKPAQTTEAPSVTAARQTVNMELAQSGNDISVASIAKLANRPPQVQQTGPNEVTITLH
jgi:hypothetical protein